MKVIIIDDEINSRELLENMMQNYCEGIEVLGLASNVADGIALIEQKEPDLVFLDIEMPGGDGFAVLEAFPNPTFRVVFVTGYPQSRFENFAYSSLAWLQKPVDLEELQLALKQSGMLPPTSHAQLTFYKTQVENKTEVGTEELLLPAGSGYERIRFQDVAYLAAHRSYSAFHLINGDERLASLPLGHYEKILPANLFFRVHKSYLVNARMVKSYEGGRGGNLSLKNIDVQLPIAARRKSDFVKFIRNFDAEF